MAVFSIFEENLSGFSRYHGFFLQKEYATQVEMALHRKPKHARTRKKGEKILGKRIQDSKVLQIGFLFSLKSLSRLVYIAQSS